MAYRKLHFNNEMHIWDEAEMSFKTYTAHLKEEHVSKYTDEGKLNSGVHPNVSFSNCRPPWPPYD